MSRPGIETQTPGALYELVARGKKDTFFFSKEIDADHVISPFAQGYESTNPHLGETRTIVPRNAIDWGRIVEFELETFGDLLRDLYLRIQMPTWLPSMPLVAGGQSYDAQQLNWIEHIVDADDGNSYGWTRGIGYFLFERIQILQDTVLIQDVSGDSLYALSLSANSNNQYYLDAAQTGQHEGGARAIAAAATPGLLRVRVPFPGTVGLKDGGFPICATKGQTFRVRVHLRRPEQLWEAATATTKAPWNARFATSIGVVNGSGRSDLKPPTILLETTQDYLDAATVRELVGQRLEIPFIQYFDQIFTIGANDYLPLDNAGVAFVQRRMEGRHPIERLLFIFRLDAWLKAGQRWRFATDPAQQFYNTLSLQIAGREREYAADSATWTTMMSLVADERVPNVHLSSMRWNTEYDRENRQPTGTVNFSTASRPTLAINLRDVPTRSTQLQICGESWAMYEVVAGRCRLLYID
jgi:hypothetical protein